MEFSLLDLLSAGGNTAMMALLFVMWRFDRRLLLIETTMNNSSSCWECKMKRKGDIDANQTNGTC